MEKYKVIATVDQSAGNEVAGETWTDTAIFDPHATIDEVMKWAAYRKCQSQSVEATSFRGRLTLNVALNAHPTRRGQ